uniref:YicC family protein n=1 Tax=Acidobacterium capsulatum TaxID=33075 RepID=A0A7V4XRX7_9BACT
MSTVYSMTGFARVEGKVSEGLTFTLALKSVNHRFLDLNLRLPGGSDALEMKLRPLLKEKLRRGHIELTLSLSRTASGRVSVDTEMIRAYAEAFRNAAADLDLATQPDLNTILRLPGVISQDARANEDSVEALEAAVLAQIDALIEALNTMRLREGDALRADLRGCLDRLAELVEQVASMREGVQQAYFERIQQRMSKMLDGNVEESRLLQEAALLAERSSIDEELVRLRAHIQHFHELLDAGGEVGKKLDFLLQEFNREANTLLSKTSGVAGNGTRITELGLAIKSEIEKAREQVQNLE